MGEVYRARDLKLKRDVALKVLPAALAGDRERLARFQREAESLAALNHPHIAQIYGVNEPPPGSLNPNGVGCRAARIYALVLRETLRPVGVGVVVGVLAAGASSQLLERGLFGISPFDPIAFVASALFMLGVATTATVLPTRTERH